LIRTGENQTKYEGEFEIPNLSDENDINEVTITFTVEKSKGDKLKQMMRKEGQVIMREKLADYIRLLREEFSQGLILPTKNTTNTQSVNTSKTVINTQLPTNLNKSSSTTTATTQLKDIKIQDTFKCTKVELFQAFCDLNKVKAFTQNSVTLYDCKKGGFFSLLSDNVTGRFLDIVPYDRIDMLWRFKSWPSDHYSRVSLTFHDDTDQTKLIIQQTGVPAQYAENAKVCSRYNHTNR
jgi:activator of HSP90 ATPase